MMFEIENTDISKIPVPYRVMRNINNTVILLVRKIDQEEVVCYLKQKGYAHEENGWYKNFDFRYQLEPPISLKRKKITIEIFNKIPCASLTPRTYIPLDDAIQMTAWEAPYVKNNIAWLPLEVEFIYILTICIFLANLSDAEKFFLTQHINFCDSKHIVALLRKVFFNFTNDLIHLVREKDFSNLYDAYISFKEY